MSMTKEQESLWIKRRDELNSDEQYQQIVGDIKSTVANIRVTQEERIRESNRNHEKADGSSTKNAEEATKTMKTSDEHKEFVNKMVSRLRETEQMWVDHLAQCIKKHPVYDRWLKNISGCGPALSGDMIAEFKVQNVPYVGNLFSYAGIIGDSKRKKGEIAKYNVYLKKRLLGVLPGSFLKARSPYAVYYYEYRIRMIQRWMNSSDAEKAKLSLGHQHMMANRYMVQRFVRDYYVAFRTIMSLPVIVPYEVEKLGMVHAGNTWTTAETFLDLSAAEKKELKEKPIVKIAELKDQLDHLVKTSGISTTNVEDIEEDED